MTKIDVYENSELNFSHEQTKFTTIYWATIWESFEHYQKRFSITKCNKSRTTMKWAGKMGKRDGSGYTALGQWPTSRRDLTIIEVLPKEWKNQALHQASQPGSPTTARWDLRTSGFETTWAYVWESWGNVEGKKQNKTALKECEQNLTLWVSAQRQ